MSYKCTNGERCVACNAAALEFHHLISRGSDMSLSDDDRNKMPLCRQHHTEAHQIGRTSFAKKYPSAYLFMVNKGWKQCALTNKWYLTGE